MMNQSISLDGIEKAVSGLGYKNPNTQKCRLIQAIKSYYTDKDAINEVESIPPEALISAVWSTETNPNQIRSKLKNLNSIKSSINKDLILAFEKGTNPEGIIIGSGYLFDMSDEAKDQFIGSMSGALSAGGPISIEQIAKISQQFGEFLTKIPDENVLKFLSTLIESLNSDRPLPPEEIPQMLNLFGNLLSHIPDHELLKEKDKISELVRHLSEKSGDTAIENVPDDSVEVVDVLVEDDDEAVGAEETGDDDLEADEDEGELEEIDEDELIEELVEDESGELDEFETIDDEGAEVEEVPDEQDDSVEVVDVLVEDDDEAVGAEETGDDDLEADEDEGELEEIDEDELIEELVEDESGELDEFETIDDEGAEVEEVPDEQDDSVEVVDVLVEDDDEAVEAEETGDDDLEADEDEGELEEIDEDELIEELVEDESGELDEFETIDDEGAEVEEVLDEVEAVAEPVEDAETPFDNFDAPYDAFMDDDLTLNNALSDRERKRLLAERFERYLGEIEKHYNQYLLIPGGEYIIGAQNIRKNERPIRKITISDIFFGRFPVTNALFEVFVERTGYKTTAEECGFGIVYQGRFQRKNDEISGQKRYEWNATSLWEERENAYWYQPSGPGSTLHLKRNHPVVQVSFRDAMAFASWVGKRLPSEAEWEAAARTASGNIYPWGNEWKEGVCNTEESEISDTVPVDNFSNAKNPLGLFDLLGNTLEWTSDRWEGTYGASTRQDYRIVKGGSWVSSPDVTLQSWFKYPTDFTANILGFRCLAD